MTYVQILNYTKYFYPFYVPYVYVGQVFFVCRFEFKQGPKWTHRLFDPHQFIPVCTIFVIIVSYTKFFKYRQQFQVFAYTKRKQIMSDDNCLDAASGRGPIKLIRCHGMRGNQEWTYDAKVTKFIFYNNNQYLLIN